ARYVLARFGLEYVEYTSTRLLARADESTVLRPRMLGKQLLEPAHVGGHEGALLGRVCTAITCRARLLARLGGDPLRPAFFAWHGCIDSHSRPAFQGAPLASASGIGRLALRLERGRVIGCDRR